MKADRLERMDSLQQRRWPSHAGMRFWGCLQQSLPRPRKRIAMRLTVSTSVITHEGTGRLPSTEGVTATRPLLSSEAFFLSQAFRMDSLE